MEYTFTELHFEQIIGYARKGKDTDDLTWKHSYMELILKIAEEYIQQDDEKRVYKK